MRFLEICVAFRMLSSLVLMLGMASVVVAQPLDRHRMLVRTAPGVEFAIDADGSVWFIPSDTGMDLAALLDAAWIAGAIDSDRILFMDWLVDDARSNPLAVRHRLDRYLVVEFDSSPALDGAIEALNEAFLGDGIIEWVAADPEGGIASVPDDPSFGLQYALRNIGQTVNGQVGTPGSDMSLVDAWTWTTGSPDLRVAVLDAGVDQHVEFADRLQPGWNIPDNNDNIADQCGSHGTIVSGIIGARGNNGVGVAGVAWNVELMPVVVLEGCTGFESWVAEGIYWAVEHDADIINYSLQYSVGTVAFQDAVAFAHASGVLQCAAAGNTGAPDDVQAPARFEETLGVAAIDNTDTRWLNSSQGPEVDLAAAGWGVVSCVGVDSYAFALGTSMAAPHVTGLLALLKTLDPSLSQDGAKSVLCDTAADIASPGFDEQTGFGRPNAMAAILALGVDPPPAGDLNNDGNVDGLDFGLLLSSWGPCGDCEEDPCSADLNGDCEVNGNDVGLLLVDWTL
jgi:subtilisin family serine protease